MSVQAQPDPFRTVHDLGLSADELAIWGSLPRAPDLYPRIDGMSPQDSALSHMVLVCLHRRDFQGARRYASMMSDPKERAVRLGLLPQSDA